MRDLMIAYGKGSFQRLHRTFRRLRQKRATGNEHDFVKREEWMGTDVMDADGSLHQKPRDACVMEAATADESSLRQKSNGASILEDVESVDLRWFENTKLNRVKNGTRILLQVGVRDWESLGTSPSRMDAKVEGEDEVHPSKKATSSGTSPHTRSRHRISDFDVIEFLRSSPNPVVAFSEVIRRAAVRRGYPVMRSRFLNFGDDIHDQSVRDRITDAIQRVPPRLLILAFPCPVCPFSIMPPLLDRERESGLTEKERQISRSWRRWYPCANCKKRPVTCFSSKIQWAPRAGTNLRLKGLGAFLFRLKEFHICVCSGSRIRGAEESSRDPSGS